MLNKKKKEIGQMEIAVVSCYHGYRTDEMNIIFIR